MPKKSAHISPATFFLKRHQFIFKSFYWQASGKPNRKTIRTPASWEQKQKALRVSVLRIERPEPCHASVKKRPGQGQGWMSTSAGFSPRRSSAAAFGGHPPPKTKTRSRALHVSVLRKGHPEHCHVSAKNNPKGTSGKATRPAMHAPRKSRSHRFRRYAVTLS